MCIYIYTYCIYIYIYIYITQINNTKSWSQLRIPKAYRASGLKTTPPKVPLGTCNPSFVQVGSLYVSSAHKLIW